MRSIAILLVSVVLIFGGCARPTVDDTGSSSEGARIQLFFEDGRSVSKPIALENPSELEGLKNLVGAISARFVLTLNTKVEGGSFSQRVEGNLANGSLEGELRTFLVLDGKSYLSGLASYAGDKRDGRCESFYPTTGNIQMRGAFRADKREGEFEMFYPAGRLAAKVSYTSGTMDGPCEVFDSSGAQIAAGVYSNGAPRSGTFVEDLEAFIWGAFEGRPIAVKIVAVQVEAPNGDEQKAGPKGD